MKIRNGFVSNSSSSSFIITDDITVKELSEKMIPIVDYKPQIDEVVERLENMENPNKPVRFYSCNYHTYIYKHKDLILVETCNNEDWDSIYNGYNVIDTEYSSKIEETLEKYPELDPDKDGYISLYSFMKDKDFMCLENGFEFTNTSEWLGSCELEALEDTEYFNERTGLCGGELMMVMGEVMCTNCYRNKEGKISKYKTYIDREKKLERIDESTKGI